MAYFNLPHALPLRPAAAAVGALLLCACGDAVDADTPPRPANVEMPTIAVEGEAEPLAPANLADAQAEACDADLIEPFMGRQADFQVRSTVLESVEPIVNVRWVKAGEEAAPAMEMTQLTIDLDEDGTIRSATCD